MSPLVVAILIGIGTTGVAGSGWYFEHRARVAERAQAQQAAQEASGALAACEERTVPETVRESAQGTTDALTAALAPEMTEMQARLLLVQSIPQAELARAVIATGSPQSIAAHAALAGCWAANTTGDSARSGCAKEIPEAWAESVAALPSCPDLARSGAPGEGD
jgi:hypothetical protein